MSVNCCLRSLLTILHALTGLAAGFLCVYSLTDFDYETCLPDLIDLSDNQVPFKTGILGACEILVYGMAAICILNLVTCLIINYLWKNACVIFTNLLLTLIYITFAIMCGTAIAVYYVIWCDTLERQFLGSHGCQDAAQMYDSYNHTGEMSLYKTHMEIQMASILAMCPLLAIAIVIYSLTMRLFAKPDSIDERFRYIILHNETRPLLRSDSELTSYQTQSSSTSNLPHVAPEPANPFDN